MTRGNKGFFSQVFTPGTLPCAIACSVFGLMTALMLLWGGVWRTLLAAALIAAFAFVGGVRDKKAFLRRFIHRSEE